MRLDRDDRNEEELVFKVDTGAIDSKGKKIYNNSRVYAYKPNSYLDGIYTIRWNKERCAWLYWDELNEDWVRNRGTYYLIGNNKHGAYCEVQE